MGREGEQDPEPGPRTLGKQLHRTAVVRDPADEGGVLGLDDDGDALAGEQFGVNVDGGMYVLLIPLVGACRRSRPPG